MPDDDPGRAHTIQLMIGRSIPNTNSHGAADGCDLKRAQGRQDAAALQLLRLLTSRRLSAEGEDARGEVIA
jgi:hypothetical protein